MGVGAAIVDAVVDAVVDAACFGFSGKRTVRSWVLDGSIAAFLLGAGRVVGAIAVKEADDGAVEAGGADGAIADALVADVDEVFGGFESVIVEGDGVVVLAGGGVGGRFGAAVVAFKGGMIELSSSSQSISSSATVVGADGGLNSAALVLLSADFFAVDSLGEVGALDLLDADVGKVDDSFKSDSCRRATSSAFFPVCGRERDLSSSSSSAFLFLL